MKALVTPAEDPGLVPITHVAYHTTSSREPDPFFWPPQAPDIHDAFTHTPNAHIRININLKQQQQKAYLTLGRSSEVAILSTMSKT